MILDCVRDPATGLEAALAICTSEGLAFGGTRFSADCSVEEVANLARCMEVKLHPHTRAVHGAKAGFFCAPDDPGLPALMALAAEQWRLPMRERVLLGKDMGATDALVDQLYALAGQAQLDLLNSDASPKRLRDFAGYRKHMTGQGVCWALSEFVQQHLQGLTVAIQGFGAVGLGAAIRLTRAGAHVHGLSDIEAAYSFDLPPDEAQLLAMAQGGLCCPERGPFVQTLPRDALFSLPVDAIVLAAGSHSVGPDQAAQILAAVVVEGSNFGLTEPARTLLRGAGLPVLPDVIASSASAAMVALQMEACGELGEAELWGRVENCIREQVRVLRFSSTEPALDLRARAFATAGVPSISTA